MRANANSSVDISIKQILKSEFVVSLIIQPNACLKLIKHNSEDEKYIDSRTLHLYFMRAD